MKRVIGLAIVCVVSLACTTTQPSAPQSAPPQSAPPQSAPVGPPRPPPPPPPTSATLAAPATSATPATPAAPEVGLWHEPGKVDATNLEIASDGTFAWDIDGCDFRGGGSGRWHRDAASGGIVFEPKPGEPKIKWLDEVGIAMVPTLNVRRNGDRLTVTGDNDVRSKKIAQTWESGTICAVCGGHLGPTGTKKCDHKVRHHD